MICDGARDQGRQARHAPLRYCRRAASGQRQRRARDADIKAAFPGATARNADDFVTS
jgi:hypothetical protein